MNRREFLRQAAIMASVNALPPISQSNRLPEISLTFDDPTTEGTSNLKWPEINERILTSLAKHKVKSVLFVCGKRVNSDEGRQLLSAWDNQGHLIANHSYSHLYFNQSPGSNSGSFKGATLQEFEADAVKNEPLIRDYIHFTKLFRYPYFKEGDTVTKRDDMRSFLQERGYRIRRATVDASDWAIDLRMQKRLEISPQADLAGYRDFYLDHIWNRAQFYDSLALRFLGKPVRHTVVLHHNGLNALFADDLITMFVRNGWKPVDAQYAYEDPIYDRQPQILPAGESLIWALAKESGKFDSELRYPGEDDVYENPKMDALKL